MTDRKIPDPPLGDQGWKQVSKSAYQRNVNLGFATLIGRVSPSHKEKWYASVIMKQGRETMAALDEERDTVDEGQRACDRVLAHLDAVIHGAAPIH